MNFDLRPGVVCCLITLAAIAGVAFTKSEVIGTIGATTVGGYFGLMRGKNDVEK